jgi:hypothetical protein
VGQARDQRLELVQKLPAHFNFGKQAAGVKFLQWARKFPLSSLQQVGAITGTVQRDLALLAAALRADAAVHGGAETLLFTGLANCAAHSDKDPAAHYGIARTFLLVNPSLRGAVCKAWWEYKCGNPAPILPVLVLSLKKPHKMRLGRFFSTEGWYIMAAITTTFALSSEEDSWLQA